MRKHRYRVKAKRLIAGLIATITILNPLLESSAGVIQTIAAEEVLTAEGEKQLITVKLNEMNAVNSVKEKEVITGETYGTLPTPIREGYIFEGWYTEKSEGIHITETTEVQADISELFAHWKPIEIKVDLYGFGVDDLASKSITVVYGHTFANLPLLEKEGYIFEGWFTSPNGETQISNQSQVTATSPIALYARWSGKKVTVSFDETEAIVNPASITVDVGDVYGSLPVPERAGYDFCGWFLDEVGATEITADTLVSTQKDHVLYAGWKEQEHKIVLDAQGGKCGTSAIEVKVGEKYGELPVASYDGHVFLGWYDGMGEDANRITSETIVSTNALKTLYAKWRSNNYTVTLVSLMDGVENSAIEVTYGNAYEKLPWLSKKNYTFLGWYTKAADGTKIENKDIVEITSDQTLYAQWEGNKYIVTFDAVGGAVSTEEKEVVYGTAYGKLPTPTKKGYIFDGWYTSTAGKTLITEDDKVTLTGNQTLYAHWTPREAAIKLSANGGQMVYNGECVESCTLNKEYDEYYEELPVPWREGYTFLGWYTAKTAGEEITNVSRVEFTTDTVLYARWSGNKYTVTFDARGGSVAQKSIQVTTGEDYGELPVPEKKNYVFKGWYTALEDGSKILSTTNSKLTGDQTLYALYEGVKIKLTYNANGGSCAKQSATVYYGDVIDSLPTPTNAGYVFKGWYTANKTKVEEGDTITFSEDTTLYAHWQETTYTITFNPNGGLVSSTEKEVKHGQSYGSLPRATRDGYAFLGWFTSKTGSTQIFGSDIVNLSADDTLYAHWSPYTYTVTFNMNGGTATVYEKDVTFGGSYGTLPTPKRSGYTFAGWYTKSRYGSKVTATSNVEIDSDHTLYAQWTSQIFVITFKPNGGTVDVTNVAVPVGTSYSSFPVPEREGYNFAGWYTSASGGTRITSLSVKDILYAHWTGKNYTVYFDAVDGTVSQTSKKVVYADTYGTLPTPTKSGMEFAGWYTAKTGGTKVTKTTSMKTAGNHTLYAHWKGISSKLSYDSNGGKAITSTKTVTFGEKYGTLSTPTRTGYTFLGWYTSPTGGKKITSDTIVATTVNQTVYAHWEPKKITIRFSANNGRVVVNGYKVAIEERIYTYGQTFGDFPDPQREGYKFLGWYTTTSTAGTKMTEGEICNLTVDETLYACWSGIQNKVLFDANGGEVDTGEKTVTYGGTYGTLPTPIREGYSFKGWYDRKIGGTKVISTTMVELLAAQTLYARWEVEEFRLTLDGNGGGYSVTNASGGSSWLTSRSMSIPYGCNYVGKETNFGTFSRKGYYFNGFFTEPEGGTQVTIATEFLHDTKQTIYAQWVPLKINVLYETGKADDVYQCSKLTYGSEYGEFPTVSRTGYSLDGWSIDGKSTLIDETTSVGTAKAHSLTAKWTANQYVLHYDANGGSVDEASKTVTYGAGIGTLEKPTRTGYKFEGWYTQRTGGYEISASDTYLKAENMTVFAHWSKTGNQIILFYKPNGGKCTESSKTVYPGYTYGELAEAQREGYVFTGWYKNSQGTGLVTEGDTVTDTKNISLYAGWDAKESNVFFDSTGGSVGISVKTVSYGETYGELPVPTKDYYTFSGWYTQPEGGTKILESSKVNISDTTILYAQWTPMPYEVYFDANGGTVDVKQKTVAYEQEYGELPVPLYEGMDFIGWYTDKENGYCVKKETLVQIAQNHTLYARWEGSFTTVKFDANGGKAEESEKTIVSGTEVGTIPTAERRGYELTGWYTLPDGGEFVSETYIVSGEEVTFYAQWKPLEIVVTFDAQDGTVQNAEKQVLFGEAYGELPDAVLPGYQFVGWYLEKEGQTKIEKETIVDVENNHTLFAYYVKKDDIPQAEIQEFYFGEEGANPASGNISFSVTDMVMNIPGLEQELVRTYNSKDRVPKSMGKGWTFGFEASYELYADGAIIYLPNGSVDVFTLTEDGYVGNNNHNKLQVNEDGSAVLMQKDQVKYGFQNDGRLAYIEDRNGNRTKVSYTNGMISELCDPVGRVYTITANLDGLITEITDPMGGKIIYAYDENNLLTHVTNLLGGVTTYEYDKNGYLYRIIDPNDNVIQEFEYVDSVALDGAEISRSMDAYGGITEYAYYEEDNYTVITDESDRKWTYWYDSNMRVTAVQNPDGSMYTTEYVEYEEGIHHADVKSTTDEYGSRNQYEYDANGNIIKATYADGSTEEFLYDELNNLLMKKSETGEHTYFCYDKDGINLLKQVQKTNGGEIKLTPENAYEVLAGITAKDGGYIVTEFDYYTKDEAKGMFDCNLSGLLESETNAEGESFVYTYDQYGNTATETDIAGNTKQYTYDMLGHKLSEVTPNGDEFKWSYLPNGYATREYYPDGGVVVSQYDAAGRLTQTVSQELYEAEKDYGNLYKGKTGTFYEYNPSGRLGSITNALGNKVQYTYDCSGNLIKEEVEGAEVYSYEYDERDRLIKQWYQETAKEPKVLLKEAAYEVLEDGGYQVKTTYYADSETGVTQVTVYDEKGREKEEYILAGDEKLEHTQYTYFADNKVASVQNGDYSTYYQYNVLGNVTQLLEPVEQESGEVLYRKTVYEYDRAGRMIKELVYHAPVVRDSISLFMETPETDTTVYYYEDGLLVKETNPNGVSTHYSYDADGNVIQILVGDGTPEDGTARKITQGFDFRKNMIYQTQYVNAEDLEGRTTASGNLVALTTTYAYDKEGRLAEETAPDGIKTVYEYDAVGNQISLQKPVLDAAGNTIGEYRVSAEYDAKGQMVSFTDSLGNVTRYSYDNRGNLLCTEDALGGTSLTEYNYNNQKVLEVSPANYLDGQAPEKMSHTEYMYDNAGRLVEITDYTMENGTLVNKAVQSHEYNADGHVIRSTDAEGHTTEFGYTPAGQQAYEIAANGNKTEYGYDVYGQLSKIDNGINQVYYSYDFSGNLLEAGDEYGTMERFAYDMFGNAVTYTDGNGNQTRYTYNAFGEVASAALPEDETIGGLTTYYRYDTMGRVKMVYDTEGSTTRYAYDSMGNVTQVEMEDPETGKKITAFAEYDVNSQEVMRMDAAGLRTESKYDALGRLVEQKTYSSTEQGRQKTVSYTYDAGGNLLSETDWLGNTIRKEYDAWNRLTAEYDALGNLIGAYTYDKIGNQTSVTDAMGNTTRYEYDEAGKLKILTEATGAESRYTYDAGGNITSITDALGYSHQYSYDGRNRLVSATIPTGDTVEYTYDNNDNLLVQKDGNGNCTVYEYNVRNLEISRQDAAEDAPDLTAPKETRRYHADGSLLEVVDRNGVSTTYRYDAFGRMTQENAGGNAKNYVYDTAGNVLITANGAEIVERTYDAEGRVTSKTASGMGTVTYEYDIPLGQGECAETMSTPDGVVTTTVYDAAGRIREVSDNMGNSVHYVYNANGSRQATVYADGTREDYTYDAAQRVIQLKHTDAYGNLLDYYEYSYDPNGNLLEEASNRGITTYTYDGADRLESVTEPEGKRTVYTYDAAGNRKTMETWYGTELAEKRTYAYDERNCLLAETVDGTTNVSYAYDANGNLLKKVSGTGKTQTATGQAMTLEFAADAEAETATGSAVELYTYDTYNRMTSYTGSDTYAEYGYNAEDYRCYKNVQENGFFDETYYFYEGSHVIMEADSTGTINAHNMYGTHLAARTVDGQSCYYLYNAHGDVVMLMDAVTGEVAGTYQYDAFGTLLWSDGYADNSITYAGYQYDEESGLYYLNARYYDSTTARFLTEDTYRGRQNDPLSLNRYTYCQNNPIHYTDPSGHSFLGAALAKFVGGAVINGVVELASQVFIEKREKVDWGSVLFEAAVGGVEGVFGGTGGKVVKKFAGEVLEETAEYGLKKTAKKVTGVVVHDAVSGFATDVAYQKIVEDKSWDEVDYGSAVRSAAVDGLMGGVIELGSDAVKSAVGSFNTSRRNVDINVDPGVDVDVDAPKKKTDAPSKKTDTPSTKTDTTTKKSVDVPEAEPAPKSTLSDMPEKAKSAGASVSSTPNMPKSSTPELPSVSNKATEVMDELGDNVPAGRMKMNLQFFAENPVKSGSKTNFYATTDGTIIPANKVKVNSQYDRLEVEVYSGNSMRPKNATDDWDSFLGPNQTDIDPRTGQQSLDRIWSADGTRSIRFGDHEMGGMGTKNFHYHRETWYDDYVYNEVQRIQPR